jgi:hypothetical protein
MDITITIIIEIIIAKTKKNLLFVVKTNVNVGRCLRNNFMGHEIRKKNLKWTMPFCKY